MNEIIQLIKQKNFLCLRDIILYRMNQYTTIVKDNVNIKVDFYEEGTLRNVRLISGDKEVLFRNMSEYNTFLFIYEIFESKGEYLLRKYIEQHNIKSIQDFIKEYSISEQVALYHTKKLVFRMKLYFEKDFIIKKAVFLNEEGYEYAKLSSEEFYIAINNLKINK